MDRSISVKQAGEVGEVLQPIRAEQRSRVELDVAQFESIGEAEAMLLRSVQNQDVANRQLALTIAGDMAGSTTGYQHQLSVLVTVQRKVTVMGDPVHSQPQAGIGQIPEQGAMTNLNLVVVPTPGCSHTDDGSCKHAPGMRQS